MTGQKKLILKFIEKKSPNLFSSNLEMNYESIKSILVSYKKKICLNCYTNYFCILKKKKFINKNYFIDTFYLLKSFCP